MTGERYNPTKFVFLTDTHANRQAYGRRSIELADSTARSHAARISHEVRRTKGGAKRRPIQDDEDSWEPVILDIAHAWAADRSINDISCGFLDPFMRLPVDYDMRQRDLLHQYITTFPSLSFAPPTTATFSVFQNAVVPTITKQESFANWAIFYAQVNRCQARGRNPERDVLCLQYAAKAYKCMNTMVMHADGDPTSDAILAGVIGGASVQYVLGRQAEAQKHLEAGLTLCELRQEKKNIQDGIDDELGPSLNSLYVGMGVQNYFKNHVTLKAAGTAMVQRLLALQDWNVELRFRPHDDKVIPKPLSDKYIHARDRLSSANSIVRGHVLQLLLEDEMYCQRVRLGILYAMNTVLWACRDNETDAVEYVDDLFHYLTAAELRPYNGGTPSASSMVNSDTTYFCAARAQKCYCDGEGGGEFRYDLWDVVKFVELMMLASEASRARMNSTMSLWILTPLDAPPDRLIPYTEADMDDLVHEIGAGLVRKQAILLADKTNTNNAAAEKGASEGGRQSSTTESG